VAVATLELEVTGTTASEIGEQSGRCLHPRHFPRHQAATAAASMATAEALMEVGKRARGLVAAEWGLE